MHYIKIIINKSNNDPFFNKDAEKREVEIHKNVNFFYRAQQSTPPMDLVGGVRKAKAPTKVTYWRLAQKGTLPGL